VGGEERERRGGEDKGERVAQSGAEMRYLRRAGVFRSVGVRDERSCTGLWWSSLNRAIKLNVFVLIRRVTGRNTMRYGMMQCNTIP
jgi:hypothetical protein